MLYNVLLRSMNADMKTTNQVDIAADFLRDVLRWDVRTWAVALAFWAKHLPQTPRGLRALEIGCGHGGLSLWLATQGYTVVCSDVESDFAAARALHQRYGLVSHIVYEQLDGSNISYVNHFDVIMFKSVLGAVGRAGGIDLQRQAIAQMRQALRPGGVLCFAENLQGSPLHRLGRKHFVTWGQTWRYPSLAELETFLTGFRHYTLKTTGFFAAFGRSERQRHVLAAIDQVTCHAWMPERCKYVGYGMAVK